MRSLHSLRFRLSILYLLTIAIPTVIIIFTMPSYYQSLISGETKTLTESVMTALSRDIDTYLEDLDHLTRAPYFDQKFMDALTFRASDQYEASSITDQFNATKDIEYTLTDYLQNTREDILSTVLVLDDGTSYATNKISAYSGIKPDYNFLEQSWYKKADAANGKVIFISGHSQDYFSIQPASQVFSVARVIKEPNTQKRLAFIMADADSVVLNKIFSGISFNVSSIVSLFDVNGNLIYSNHKISPELKKQLSEQKTIVNDGRQSYTLVTKTVERSQWKMTVLLSYNEIKAKFRWIYLIGIMFAIGELIIAFSLFIIFSRIITNPFKRMTRVMKEVEKGNLHAQLVIKGNDEVSQLGSALNNMLFRLNDLIDREYRAVLSKRNAEYSALQSQIQPHFLYNTLNGFIGLNRLGQREALEKAILDLKGMLRYTLEHGEWTSISEEFLLLQRYCELQKIRFGDRFEINMNCDKLVEEVKIPKLLIQPLVENAIIHGIEPLDREGLITVQAGLSDDGAQRLIRISVIDNGAGFDMENTPAKENVGLSNVRERLMLAFNRAGFTITSAPGSGTEVVIEIPEEDVIV